LFTGSANFVAAELFIAIIVNLSVGSAVERGDHKSNEVAAGCVDHVRLAQVFSLSLPQIFPPPSDPQ
jgi:hypothetical protein